VEGENEQSAKRGRIRKEIQNKKKTKKVVKLLKELSEKS